MFLLPIWNICSRSTSYCLLRSQSRYLSSTSLRKAAENPDSFIAAFKNTSIFQKLADKPEALAALTRFAKLMQENGVDISAGQPPSTMQMVRLASNSEFREGARSVVNELQKAGVDFNTKEMLDEIMNARKGGSGS